MYYFKFHVFPKLRILSFPSFLYLCPCTFWILHAFYLLSIHNFQFYLYIECFLYYLYDYILDPTRPYRTVQNSKKAIEILTKPRGSLFVCKFCTYWDADASKSYICFHIFITIVTSCNRECASIIQAWFFWGRGSDQKCLFYSCGKGAGVLETKCLCKRYAFCIWESLYLVCIC